MINARKINETGKGKEERTCGGQGICSFRQDDQRKYQWELTFEETSEGGTAVSNVAVSDREESKYLGPRVGCLVWKQDSKRGQRGSRAGGLRESIRTCGQEVMCDGVVWYQTPTFL